MNIRHVLVFNSIVRTFLARSLVAGWHANLAGTEFVVFDGNEAIVCRDVATAIAAVLHLKRWCSAVDLYPVRTGTTES